MATTIKDVAERAQVSTATVSYVLNGTGSVAAATRRRVLDAVAALSYQPNHAARSLRTRSRTLGLVLPPAPTALADPALAELVAGLSEGAADGGYYLLLAAQGARSEAELSTELAQTGRIDGLVLLDPRIDDERALILTAAGIPYVAAGAAGNSLPYPPSVGLDLERGAYDATRHLLQLGHRRIAMIALPSDLVGSESFYQGFTTALAESGCVPDPELIVEAGATQEAGMEAMEELLSRPEPPSAVLAASDILAFGAMHALYDAGLVVGSDLALVGCGDLPLAAHTHPPLTTLRVPRRSLGVALAKRLIALIERHDLDPQPLLSLSLMIRRSSVALQR